MTASKKNGDIFALWGNWLHFSCKLFLQLDPVFTLREILQIIIISDVLVPSSLYKSYEF